jgi:hypothetical protein
MHSNTLFIRVIGFTTGPGEKFLFPFVPFFLLLTYREQGRPSFAQLVAGGSEEGDGRALDRLRPAAGGTGSDERLRRRRGGYRLELRLGHGE